jgi:hypothetical protein
VGTKRAVCGAGLQIPNEQDFDGKYILDNITGPSLPRLPAAPPRWIVFRLRFLSSSFLDALICWQLKILDLRVLIPAFARINSAALNFSKSR